MAPAERRRIPIALVILWTVMALLSLWRSRQWWHNPDQRPRHPLRIAAAILIPALLDLGIIYLVFVCLPDYTETPLQAVMVFAPDLAIAISVMLVLSGGKGHEAAPSPA